jgi:hypothetical protein
MYGDGALQQAKRECHASIRKLDDLEFLIRYEAVSSLRSFPHESSRKHSLTAKIISCAIARAFQDIMALHLTILVALAEISFVVQRAHTDLFIPFSSRVYPTMIASSHKLIDCLR